MLVLGIDIGARGALAPVNAETDDLLEIFDMPILRNWPGNRPNVNAPPGEGPTGAFAFRRSRGVIEKRLRCCSPSCGLPHACRLEAHCRHSAWQGWCIANISMENA